MVIAPLLQSVTRGRTIFTVHFLKYVIAVTTRWKKLTVSAGFIQLRP